MWGGTPDRNMASSMQDIPTPGHPNQPEREVGGETRFANLCNPVVAGGQVYVAPTLTGAQSAGGGDRGVLMCFRESDGQFLWQHTNQSWRIRARLPETGICSAPLVEGDRLYYVNNRCELVSWTCTATAKGTRT